MLWAADGAGMEIVFAQTTQCLLSLAGVTFYHKQGLESTGFMALPFLPPQAVSGASSQCNSHWTQRLFFSDTKH